MIKLVITDVDDTIVPAGNTNPNSAYYDAIHQLREKGIYVVVASGRQKTSIEKTFAPVRDEIMYVAENGTDIHTLDFHFSEYISNDDYYELLSDVRKLESGYEVMLCKPECAYIESRYPEFFEIMTKEYGYHAKMIEDAMVLSDIDKISVYRKDGISPEVERKMKKLWGDRLDVGLAGAQYLDFVKKGCNKGYALSKIQDYYHIKPEETVAFGNADNDIPMFTYAKYGYAVADASKRLKHASYEVIGRMEDDAVLKKMENLIH
ncbi:MAG: HAD family hydrolase [Lachnospiraceae bacterium]|nr:HAD family hydrolase [Lachnospiraceae bacterium]